MTEGGLEAMVERGRDEITLSERERRTLLEIEARLLGGDPDSAGDRRPSPDRLRWYAGPALVVVGAAVMVVSFTASLVLAMAGATLFAVGMGLAAVRLVPAAVSWLRDQTRIEDSNRRADWTAS